MKRLFLSIFFLAGCFVAGAQTTYTSPSFVTEKDSTVVAAVSDSLLSVLPVPNEPDYSVVYELAGREVVGQPPRLQYMPVQSGDITVEIKVNRYGEVSLVTLRDKGTTIIDRDLIDDVCDDAMNTLFNESATAPVFQMGTIVYRFDIPIVQKDTVFVPVNVGVEMATISGPEIVPAESHTIVSVPSTEETVVQSLELPEHLEFKKIPIDGPLSAFMNELRAAGFTYKGMKDDIGYVEGTFAGIAKSKVFAFSKGGKTYKVMVDFPGQDKWPSMKKQYQYFKQSFAAKYASAPQSIETFPKYNPEGSGFEQDAFKEEAAVYSSSYSVPHGMIILSVQPVVNGNGRLFLRLEYIDEKNSTMNEIEALDDI